MSGPSVFLFVIFHVLCPLLQGGRGSIFFWGGGRGGICPLLAGGGGAVGVLFSCFDRNIDGPGLPSG